MTVSTRGRYALRIMVELAENDGITPLRSLAEKQQISLKYLERILPSLSASGLICGTQGKNGGYRLTRAADQYTVKQILDSTDDLAPVSCLERGAAECPRKSLCSTLVVWQNLERITNEYLSSVRLSDLINNK